MRLIFMGTPEIAVPSLKRLAAEHEIVGVFSREDKPVGRKQILTAPPVKEAARELGIPVFQPKTLRDGAAEKTIRELNPDAIALIAYGRILPKEILELPKYGCINAHASLLPKFRGAAPIQRALLCGESETGITAMKMDEGLDTGEIISMSGIGISPDDDAESMFSKLGFLAADVLSETLFDIEAGRAVYAAQPEGFTLAPPIEKSERMFSFSDDARAIVNRVRAFCIWPVASFEAAGKIVKVYKARLSDERGEPGTVLSLDPMTVAASNGAVKLLEVMPENGKRMSGTAYAAGRRLKIGDGIRNERSGQ